MSDKNLENDEILETSDKSSLDDLSFKKNDKPTDEGSNKLDLKFGRNNTDSPLHKGEEDKNDSALDEFFKSEESKADNKEKAKPVISENNESVTDLNGEQELYDEPYVRRAAPAPRRNKKKKKKKKSHIRFNGSIFGGLILVTIILTVSMILAVSALTIGMEYYGIGKSDNNISFNIPEGANNDEIADLLYDNEIIKNKKLFLLALKWVAPDNIYPGDITLQPAMGYQKVIETMELQRESYQTVTITFTEGEYLIDVANKLEENGVCSAKDFMWNYNKNQGYDFEKYISNDNALFEREGYFFPDTYEFYVNDNAFNITKKLREHYDSKLTTDMYTRMNQMGMSLNDTITLASIVQLEAASIDEMPRIASVFLNRLNDPDTYPRLQSDTTTNYINNVIRKQAGSDESVQHYIEYYDTYAITGLPAGPICNPGLDAINAVLYPEDTNYYFFCNNLETGETFYAETLEEHERNLIKAGLVDAVVDDDYEDYDENYDEGYDENYDENNIY